MAIAPCLLGYGAVAQMLAAHPATVREANTYWPWIETYGAADYVEAVRLGSGTYSSRLMWHCPRDIHVSVKGCSVSFFHGM